MIYKFVDIRKTRTVLNGVPGGCSTTLCYLEMLDLSPVCHAQHEISRTARTRSHQEQAVSETVSGEERVGRVSGDTPVKPGLCEVGSGVRAARVATRRRRERQRGHHHHVVTVD